MQAGDILALLESPELEERIQATDKRIQQLTLQWQRSRADAMQRADSANLQAQLAREQAQLSNLLERREALVLRSPITGIVGNWQTHQSGDFVNRKAALVTIYDPTSVRVRAYVSGNSLGQLKANATGRFIATSGRVFETPVILDTVSPTAVE